MFRSCKVLPVSASQPFQKAKQQPWIGVKEQALRVLFALFGCGEWWHRELATTAPCTCKVGAASVHHSYAPETVQEWSWKRTWQQGEQGDLIRAFCSFLVLGDIEILPICFSDSQLVAGGEFWG